MKLDLLTFARVVDDAIRFVSDNQKRVALSSYVALSFKNTDEIANINTQDISS
jgi:hypothetical protein